MYIIFIGNIPVTVTIMSRASGDLTLTDVFYVTDLFY